MSDPGVVQGDDGHARCFWCIGSPDYVAYHDGEWGLPVIDDRMLFEKICLEGFQSGLAWLTVLRKREGLRRAFEGFEIEKVARFTPARVGELLSDAAIIRHRGKIESIVNNARRAGELIEECGSLAAFAWRFEPPALLRPKAITREILMRLSTSPDAIAMSKELRKRGWSFVGPTTAYAFMQAMGLVNDHIQGCFARARAQSAREALRLPFRRDDREARGAREN
jgi:DNA-3-methyladenine glycosylase I